MDSRTPPPDPSDPFTTAPDPAGPTRSPPRWLKWVLIGAVAVVVLVMGAVLIYANFINDPEDELTTADLDAVLQDDPAASTDVTVPPTAPPVTTQPTATTEATTEPSAAPATAPATDAPATSNPSAPATVAPTQPPGGVDGVWNVTDDSVLGYRVVEVLFGVDAEGVGRTNQITGSMTIAGTQVVDAGFEVDMASIESDDSRRDGQFRGRIMSVTEFPTSTFVLTEPIELGTVPADGEQITAAATGDLTLRGVTNPVTFEVTAQRQAERIGVLGAIPVVFADYQIANPSISGISTEDNGLLEFVLVFER